MHCPAQGCPCPVAGRSLRQEAHSRQRWGPRPARSGRRFSTCGIPADALPRSGLPMPRRRTLAPPGSPLASATGISARSKWPQVFNLRDPLPDALPRSGLPMPRRRTLAPPGSPIASAMGTSARSKWPQIFNLRDPCRMHCPARGCPCPVAGRSLRQEAQSRKRWGSQPARSGRRFSTCGSPAGCTAPLGAAHAPSPDARCGHPALRSLGVSSASSSRLAKETNAGSRGTGSPELPFPNSRLELAFRAPVSWCPTASTSSLAARSDRRLK